MSLLSRIANVFRSGRVADDLDDELAFHVESTAERLVAEGMSPEAARREAARRFGNSAVLRERSRDVKLVPWLDAVVRDIGFGFRMLRKDAVISVCAVISLGLAMGACATAFMLVDALMLRTLDVRTPERLVYLSMPPDTPTSPDGTPRREGQSFSYPIYQRFRDVVKGRAELMVMGYQGSRYARFSDAADQRERVRAHHVSGQVFDELGIVPAFGRVLTRDDDRLGAPRLVAVLSHAFWMRRFGGDPGVLGKRVSFDRENQYEIVGVAREGFTGVEPGILTDVWLPATSYRAEAMTSPGWQWFRIWGRLADGVDAQEIHGRLQPVFRQFRTERAALRPPDTPRDEVERYVSQPLAVRSAAQGPSALRVEFEQPLVVLAGVVALVLLLACSNIANLLLARATAREREMALRLSIGAGRARLVQQMLIEGTLIAFGAMLVAGVVASAAAPAVVRWLAPTELPAYLDLRLDARLAMFLAGLTLLTAVGFGLLPALKASAVSPIAALRAGGRHGTRTRLLHPLLSAQVAFSLAVLSISALLLLSFTRLISVDPGFRVEGVLLASVNPPDRLEGSTGRRAVLEALERASSVPGITSVSASSWALMSGSGWSTGIRLPGGRLQSREVSFLEVTPGFIKTMAIPLRDGRDLADADMKLSAGGEQVEEPNTVLVNQAFVRAFFPNEPALGRVFERPQGSDAVRLEIVGIVGDAKYLTLREEVPPTVYVPMRGRADGATLQLQTDLPADAVAGELRKALARVSPPLVLTAVEPQATYVTNTLLRERLLAALSLFFGAVSVALAAVGLYGVLSFSVVQRTREIGIRRALGATQRMAISRVVKDAAIYSAVGMAVGLVAGVLLGGRFVGTLLYEVTPLDPETLALPVIVLLTVAVLAAVVPARRAAAVDPMVALREE
jgi:predicted permease